MVTFADMKVYENVLKLVGKTPLVRLNKVAKDTKATVLAKLEYFNPLGSVKDRIGLSMVEDAERKGLENPVFVEATSGNTGIGIAFTCAVKGYRAVIVMPEGMSQERMKLLKALGAEVVLTPREEGIPGAVKKAEELAKEKGYIYLRQFENPSNPEMHERTTAVEIWEDTDGKVDAVVCGVGTGGTITGVARFLRKKKDVRIVAVEPKGSPVLSGGSPGPHKIQGIGPGFVPKVYDPSLVDEVITVSDEDAMEMARRLAREEGILCGISSGASVFAALELSRREESRGKLIVTIVHDTGERYLSTELFHG